MIRIITTIGLFERNNPDRVANGGTGYRGFTGRALGLKIRFVAGCECEMHG